MAPVRRAAIYCRVSLADQHPENQLRDLNEVARRSGWTVVQTLTDHGISGAKGREPRPAYRELIKLVVQRRIDVVAVWSLDRLSRSLSELLTCLDLFQKSGVDLFSYRQCVDTGSASGRLFFAVVGAFASFEREILIERTLAGMARAKAAGKRIGRPAIDAMTEEKIKHALREGRSIGSICRALHVGSSTVQRVKRAADEEPASREAA